MIRDNTPSLVRLLWKNPCIQVSIGLCYLLHLTLKRFRIHALMNGVSSSSWLFTLINCILHSENHRYNTRVSWRAIQLYVWTCLNNYIISPFTLLRRELSKYWINTEGDVTIPEVAIRFTFTTVLDLWLEIWRCVRPTHTKNPKHYRIKKL